MLLVDVTKEASLPDGLEPGTSFDLGFCLVVASLCCAPCVTFSPRLPQLGNVQKPARGAREVAPEKENTRLEI